MDNRITNILLDYIDLLKCKNNNVDKINLDNFIKETEKNNKNNVNINKIDKIDSDFSFKQTDINKLFNTEELDNINVILEANNKKKVLTEEQRLKRNEYMRNYYKKKKQ